MRIGSPRRTASSRPHSPPSPTLCACLRPDPVDDALPVAAAAQLHRAAGVGVVPDVPADVGFLRAAGQLEPTKPAATAVGDRCQGRRARPGPATPAAVGELGIGGSARRLRHDRLRAARVGRTMAPHRGQPAACGPRLGAGHGHRCGRRRVGGDPAVPALRSGDHRAVAAATEHARVRHRHPADPGCAAGEFDPRRATVRVHRGDLAGCRRRLVEPVRRPGAAPGPADVHPRTDGDRRLQPLPAQRDARRVRPGLHPHRPRQRTHAAPGAVQTRPAHGADPDGHAIRLRRKRIGDRCGVHREDLRLARHGRVGGAGHRNPGHQHHRRRSPSSRAPPCCSAACCPM